MADRRSDILDTVQLGAPLVDDILEHFGVKGMKWGVRKDRSRGKIRRGATKANVALNAGAKVIEEGEKKLIFLPQKNRDEASSATQGRMLGEAMSLNKSPQYKGKDLKTNPSLKKSYHDELAKRAAKIYTEELGIARQTAALDFIEGVTGTDMTSVKIRVQADRLAHEEDDDYETLAVFGLVTDKLGQVVDISLEQSDEGDLYLEHYGVKGMKWGVRRSKKEIAEASAEAKAASANRQKAKESGLSALTNDEIQSTVRRMQLEQQYKQLMSQRSGKSAAQKGQKVVKELLGLGKTANEVMKFQESPAGKKLAEQLDFSKSA